ncbi:MAG: hypothetical protein ACHQQ3_11250 [Gemmatimonadales bacterium]
MISNKSPIRSHPTLRRLAILAMVASAGLVGACSDALGVKATDTNTSQPFLVHALNGSQLVFATALFFPAKAVTRVDGSFTFDVAFDINAAGDVVLLPPGMVGQNPAGNRPVGIQKSTVGYDAVTEAPLNGYMIDTATVIRKGDAAIVRAQEAACSLSITPYYYAKLTVDSIDQPGRIIYGRTTINSNCGFRSLTAGLPAF